DLDPLYRLRIANWALRDADLATLVPVRDPRLRVIAFDYDVAEFMAAHSGTKLPAAPAPRRSHIVAFARAAGPYRGPLVVDALTARILALSDGTRTVDQIMRDVSEAGEAREKEGFGWIERLFVHGLIALHERAADWSMAPDPAGEGASCRLE